MKGLLVAVILCVRAAVAQTAADRQAFEFHDGFWLNLHQFLYHQAGAPDAAAPDTAAPDGPEWRAAVEYYRREVRPKGELGEDAAATNNILSAAGSSEDLAAAGLPAGLAATLAKAAPVYRRTWWPQHNGANAAWIDAVQPLLAKYGAALRKDIAAVYQVEWPAAPIRTDVAAYADPYGAYTTVEPAPHITISSTDPGYQGAASLEMLFHEASHALDERVRNALQRELAAHDLLFRRRDFSHAIIFYTAGEIARRYLPGYDTYAVRNGIWERGWPGAPEVLDKDWKPYLDGRTDLAAAVQALVRDYSVPKR